MDIVKLCNELHSYEIEVKMANKKESETLLTQEYAQAVVYIKQQIKEAQIKAALAANKELIKLYWSIGKTIVENQKKHSWGSNFIEQLAKDLKTAFPGVKGFSRANLFNVRSFYLAYEKVQQAVGQFEKLPFFNIPWGQNVIILTRLKDQDQRLWYASKTIEHGWSRSMLETWIKSDLYNREGKAITNFKTTLPAPHSDMAQQSLKDPYVFDFLALHDDYVERDLEHGLIDHIQKFLLELGAGFAFIGSQYHLEVGGDDYYIDLLFYHIQLRCYVVVELKNSVFKPEYAGKLNFYLSAVDDLLRNKNDKPTIGLLLCKTKNNVTAEYALRDINKPIGIAEYEAQIVKSLPKNLKSKLPTIEEIEAELKKKDIK
jgi:predicted nuclease of restriction endonuclease-like (RecB) superfamily